MLGSACAIASLTPYTSGYNRSVLSREFTGLALLSFVILPCAAQEAPKPQVRMNVINVCALSEAEARAMTAALGSVPQHPAFVPDFEIARGVTTLPEGQGRSRWVRMRREFPSGTPFATAQYSVSTDEKGVVETLVLRPRDTKNIVQISVEDVVTAARPEQVLGAATPATRIRIERPAGSSVVLARCVDSDQSAAQPIFSSATGVLMTYRAAFRAGTMVVAELARPDLQPAHAVAVTKKRGR